MNYFCESSCNSVFVKQVKLATIEGKFEGTLSQLLL